MPYTANNPPKVAKNWTKEEQRKCISAANATLAKGGSEQDAIFACIAAAGKSKKKENQRMSDFMTALKGLVRGIIGEMQSEKGPDDGGNDTQSLVSHPLHTTIQRQQDGSYRAFSVSAVATKNRVGEIDSRALFDSFVAIAEVTGKYPQRDFMHLGAYGEEFITGDVDFMARSDNVFITSTLYRDTELARAEIAARMEFGGDWGDSIAYVALDDGTIDREGDETAWVSPDAGFLRFVSTVPERLAASHFTTGTILQEVDRMSMSEEQLEAFVNLFQDEERAKGWLSKYVENVEEAIEEAGMMTRTIDDEPTDPAPEPVTQEIELDDEMFEMIVERVIAELEDQFAKIADSIVTLTQNVELLTGQAKERQTKVDERIDALEADDDEKQRQWLADMPRRDKQRLLVTHRPSGNPTNDEPPTAAERAEVALDGWNVDHYKQ